MSKFLPDKGGCSAPQFCGARWVCVANLTNEKIFGWCRFFVYKERSRTRLLFMFGLFLFVIFLKSVPWPLVDSNKCSGLFGTLWTFCIPNTGIWIMFNFCFIEMDYSTTPGALSFKSPFWLTSSNSGFSSVLDNLNHCKYFLSCYSLISSTMEFLFSSQKLRTVSIGIAATNDSSLNNPCSVCSWITTHSLSFTNWAVATCLPSLHSPIVIKEGFNLISFSFIIIRF